MRGGSSSMGMDFFMAVMFVTVMVVAFGIAVVASALKKRKK
jgi:hypothetical protein